MRGLLGAHRNRSQYPRIRVVSQSSDRQENGLPYPSLGGSKGIRRSGPRKGLHVRVGDSAVSERMVNMEEG